MVRIKIFYNGKNKKCFLKKKTIVPFQSFIASFIYFHSMSHLAVIDKQDLMIIGLLSINCRVSYRKISQHVNLTPNAVKNRINKMISNGIIKNIVIRVNPAILGHDKECFLTINNMKKIKQKDIINKLNLVGEVSV
ncbi:MAG TPA: winged helix-turn-helix transcriptional regulator [Verrucomicrobiae bacterium]|nr:winged helix-turn-helix transcriptional regulator [Verrucomicrobiae bacterium]